MKICPKCGSSGPFYKSKQSKDGLDFRCKKCRSDYRKSLLKISPTYREGQIKSATEWQRLHPEKCRLATRRSRLKRIYNLSLSEWQLLFEKQNKCCSICKVIDPGKSGWHTDHNHLTGKVRGIICAFCNSVLGFSRDSILILESAISYLKSHS